MQGAVAALGIHPLVLNHVIPRTQLHVVYGAAGKRQIVAERPQAKVGVLVKVDVVPGVPSGSVTDGRVRSQRSAKNSAIMQVVRMVGFILMSSSASYGK